ncbi:MAG TPA: hypothetical protein VFX49_07385 [Chloroflexota bacterium]|nr:hypothetical protein [Chloroflexota bacterium]
MSPVPANPLLDWAPALALEEALDHVRLARSFLVRMQELLDLGRLADDGRAYHAAAQNVKLRVRRALELGAPEKDVLAAAANAYRSDLCDRCGCIYYSKTEDPRFKGMCGECLYSER